MLRAHEHHDDPARRARRRHPPAHPRRALAEFAASGLAGARVDEIAARADANKRMLYAYFGSKEELWLMVLERAYVAKREEERALAVDDLPPAEAMARLVRFNLCYTARHPEFVALLNQENVHHAEYLACSEAVRALYSPLVGTLRTVLERGAAAGVFRRDADPVQTYVTLVAIGHFFVANRLWCMDTPGIELNQTLSA